MQICFRKSLKTPTKCSYLQYIAALIDRTLCKIKKITGNNPKIFEKREGCFIWPLRKFFSGKGKIVEPDMISFFCDFFGKKWHKIKMWRMTNQKIPRNELKKMLSSDFVYHAWLVAMSVLRLFFNVKKGPKYYPDFEKVSYANSLNVHCLTRVATSWII